MRAAARELHHRGPPQAERLIAVPVIDQLPADAVAVQVVDGRAGLVHDGLAAAAPDDALDAGQVCVAAAPGPGERLRQVQGRRLALSADDDIHLRMMDEDVLVVAGEDAAVDGDDAGQGRLDGAQDAQATGVGLRGADVGDHDDVGTEAANALDDLAVGKVEGGGVDEGDGEAGVEQRPAEHEQPQRHLMADAVVADGRAQRGVDQGNAQHRHLRDSPSAFPDRQPGEDGCAELEFDRLPALCSPRGMDAKLSRRIRIGWPSVGW